MNRNNLTHYAGKEPSIWGIAAEINARLLLDAASPERIVGRDIYFRNNESTIGWWFLSRYAGIKKWQTDADPEWRLWGICSLEIHFVENKNAFLKLYPQGDDNFGSTHFCTVIINYVTGNIRTQGKRH